MGDRTDVTLRVLASHKERAEALFDSLPSAKDQEGDEHFLFFFDEVNYGDLLCLDDLIEAGIPFDSEWGPGGNYGAGTRYCRFTPEGECICKSIYDEEINPDLYSLMGLIDQPDALREFILHHNEKISTLPWENQEEFGKIYQIKQLISPSQ